MKYTQAQKDAIRAHYSHYSALYFMADGRVMAKKSKQGATGLLYTPRQAEDHLKAVSLL